MNLLGGIELKSHWLDDSLILTWALARVMDERELELPRASMRAAALFDPATIKRLLATHEPAERGRLFASLPPDAFLPLIDDLVAAWPEAEPEEVSELAGALVQAAPEKALACFGDSLKLGARTTRLERLFGIGVGLSQVAPQGAKLVGPFINAVQTARLEMQLETTAVLAVLHNRPDARHFMTRWSADTPDEVLADVYELLSKDGMFDLVQSYTEDPDHVTPLVDSALAFRPDTPFDALSRALSGKHGELPVGARVGAARALPYFERETAPSLYLAGVLDSWLQRELDASTLTAKQVLDRLAQDLPRLLHRGALARRLLELPRPEVIAAFEDRRNTKHGNYAGQHLAWAAGQLADPQLIPFLIGLWDDRMLYATGEEAMDSLARIGEPAVPALVARTGADDAACAPAAGALAMIDGPAAEDALDALLARDGSRTPDWTEWLPRRPSKRLLDRLAPERDTMPYDEAAVLIQLSMLHTGPVATEEDPTPRGAPVRAEQTGRNDPCPCGSGKKYKKCCLNA